MEIGAAWVVLTVIFEFGFGHYVDGKSWSELLENYNLPAGRHQVPGSVRGTCLEADDGTRTHDLLHGKQTL